MIRPKTGSVETRTAPDLVTSEDKRIRGRVPYDVESRDLGGWREVIMPGALDGAKLDELVVTVDHAGLPLGRYPGTLELEDRSDGMHWSVSPPESRADVVEAVERGDLRAGSWRMRVQRDSWNGDVRHVHEIAELRDVSIVTAAAYESAAVEYRSQPDSGEAQEDDMGNEPENSTSTETTTTEEVRAPTGGGLQVEDRATLMSEPRRGLADEFRHRGFPAETATLSWQDYEDRAVTWTGSVDNVNKLRGTAGPLGYDQRYVWPVVPRVGVDGGVTSVDVFTQSARSLATAANVVRAISAVSAKPETGSTLTIVTTPLNQVATVQSGIPNIYLETQGFATTIENDLRLALSDGLDKLVLDKFVASSFQAPGTDNILVSVRKCITTLRAAGYAPDTLVLTPAIDEAIDVMVSGITGGSADFVFAPGQFAPGTLFGLNRRVSKTVPAPVVFDSSAFGKLYASPVSLARFEESAGSTNTSLVRLETTGVFGVERQAAAIRIAAA